MIAVFAAMYVVLTDCKKFLILTAVLYGTYRHSSDEDA